jgi:hypothetical protein
MEQLLNFLKLFLPKGDEAIYTCFKNNIKLTNKNINEVREILKQKKQKTNLK